MSFPSGTAIFATVHAPDRPASTGILVTFEGGDATGKSTQVERLAEWLVGRGHEVVVARDPGSTEVGEAVRSIVLTAGVDRLSAEAELALYVAARAQLADEIVRPALAVGRIVLLDRFGDSSVAYQGYGRGIDPARIAEWNRWATGGVEPDLTVLIDVPVDAAAGRRDDRPADRLERAGRAFHERVREGYRTIAMNEPQRFLVVDGRESIEDIQRAIRERVASMVRPRAPRTISE